MILAGWVCCVKERQGTYGTARQAWQVELGRGSVLVSLVTDWQERKGWPGMGMEWLG